MAQEDIDLTFNPTAFSKGISKAKSMFGGFTNYVTAKSKQAGNAMFSSFRRKPEDEKKQEQIAQKTKDSQGSMMGAVGKIAAIGAAIMGIVNIFRNFLPEIGQVMSVVSEVFFKNLLWPLRQFLVPMLQKILDWVRDNRAAFVKWGGVIVNIFKTVINVVKQVIGLFKKVAGAVLSVVKKIFGEFPGSISNFVNLILFKVNTLVIALGVLLEPLGDLIAGIIEGIGEMADVFGDGFSKGFGGLEDVMDDFIKLKDVFVDLVDSITILVQELFPGLLDAISLVGEGVGKLVKGTLKLLVNSLMNVIKLMSNVVKGLVVVKKIASGEFKLRDIKKIKLFEGIDPTFGFGKDKKEEKVDDAIITKDGKIIRTNPQDTLIATKTPGKMGGDVNLNLGGVNITVTEGNAQAAGENFVGGMEGKLRSMLIDNMVLQGDSP